MKMIKVEYRTYNDKKIIFIFNNESREHDPLVNLATSFGMKTYKGDFISQITTYTEGWGDFKKLAKTIGYRLVEST